eukprot:5264375-Pleurochrysis_carterae.AAC.1
MPSGMAAAERRPAFQELSATHKNEGPVGLGRSPGLSESHSRRSATGVSSVTLKGRTWRPSAQGEAGPRHSGAEHEVCGAEPVSARKRYGTEHTPGWQPHTGMEGEWRGESAATRQTAYYAAQSRMP